MRSFFSYSLILIIFIFLSGFGGCYRKPDKGLRSPCVIDIEKISDKDLQY